MSLWERDILNGVGEPKKDIRPERRLLRAILEDALRSALIPAAPASLNHERAKQATRREAWAWIMANDWDYPYSFLNVCQELKVDPDGLRRKLAAKTEPFTAKHRWS